MMDFHILIVISCVFLASLFSLLFINKFFRRKTFEEIIAEKKAMSEKIYGQTKAAVKKPKKLQQLKKEMKREKKQRQKEQQKDTTEQEDSDGQSDQQSIEEEPLQGLSKTHVEFEPDPEEITPATIEIARRASLAEKEIANSKQKSKKDKKGGKSGILINKHEPIAVKENLVVDEPLNNFEAKPPKDTVEMKKHEKEKKEEKQQNVHGNKKEKNVKKEKHAVEKVALEQAAEVPHVAKELKQQEEKMRHGSPKNQQNINNNNNNSNSNNNNKSKQQSKKQNKDTAATKELVLALDKLSENDTIGVSLLMNLFRRAELNRSEIQILIDYLLNKQQDTPSTHSEWSDDICQKLKRQLEEKEKALVEEQESSSGIQAKLRELRAEINTERAQMHATIKAYVDKIQSKEQEITGLNQEMQSLNDKLSLERQQFQAKLIREKQNGSQDLMAQLQRMQGELTLKDSRIGDLTHLVNNTQQQIRSLEQQRDELETISNNRIFELEKLKTLETENAESKVEIRNLQNALESLKADLSQAHSELDRSKSELTSTQTAASALDESRKEIQTLQAKNDELRQQLVGISSQADEQTKEQSSLKSKLDALQAQLSEKEQQLAEFNAKNAALLQQLATAGSDTQQHKQELQKLVDSLKADLVSKNTQLQKVEQSAEKFQSREKELLQQLQEQKEKNNDLRMKNWKLVEAYQNAETTNKQYKTLSSANASLVQQQQLFAASQKPSATTTAPSSGSKDDQHIREIFQRLYPEAVKACAGSALTVPFEQWVEQVLTAQQKLATVANASNSNHKSTQSNSSSAAAAAADSTTTTTNSNNHNSTHNSHNSNPLSSAPTTNNSNSRTNSSSSSESSSGGSEVQKLSKENSQLRAQIDHLTNLVEKTSFALSDIENHAREEQAHWMSVVRSKEEQISMLKHSNGEQDI